MPVSKELVAKLNDENITRKEYRQIIEQIGNEVNEIWRWICKESRRGLDWWAFRNDVSYGHGNGSSGGEFDPQEDVEWIEIGGEADYCDLPGYLYNDGFPTSFLWEDYKPIVKAHLAEIKKKHKEAEAIRKKNEKLLKTNYTKMVASIKGKLTKEELSIIKFKTKKELSSGG